MHPIVPKPADDAQPFRLWVAALACFVPYLFMMSVYDSSGSEGLVYLYI